MLLCRFIRVEDDLEQSFAPESIVFPVFSGRVSSVSGDSVPAISKQPRYSDELLWRYVAQQREIFSTALRYLKPGGKVVYSTCSIHPIENELVVAAALRDEAVRAAGWRLAPALPSWPCRGPRTKYF